MASKLKPGTGGDATIDRDNICYNTDHAFVFVSNNCSQVGKQRSSPFWGCDAGGKELEAESCAVQR